VRIYDSTALVFSGLTRAQLEAAVDRMAEDEYEGAELVGCTAKMLRKLLRGSDAEAAVPALLAARDAHLAAEREAQQAAARAAADAAAATAAEVAAAAAVRVAEAASAVAAKTAETAALVAADAAAKAAPSCGVCFEPYGDEAVPRMLTSCGHTFCEGCLSMMLRCARRYRPRRPAVLQALIVEPLTVLACEQAVARYQRTETAGVPEVPQAVRRQGRARGRAADQLRHHGRLTIRKMPLGLQRWTAAAPQLRKRGPDGDACCNAHSEV
jgi:hypothetical protein